MYSYEWDPSTGGYILNSTPLQFSKEPRPVYYKELDILGFDKYWNYDKNDAYPYMWAEAANYFYRGRLVAKTKGGSLYTAPEPVILEEPEPNGAPLRFVDIPAMVEKNRDLLEKLVNETTKNIYNTYVKYRDVVDVFYVAFSGGKDSVTVLDLVRKALPHNRFKVLFGDTCMEFPDTYKIVDEIERECKVDGIDFFRSRCQFEPEYTWRQFGPPATVTRWCCSVHKTAPQITTLRKRIGKHNFTGMAFIGVRGSESLARSEYDYVSLGEKHKGQYSCNPILEWNSAELFCYMYANNLILNEAYKKGNRRVGCLVCPRASERNEYMSRVCYPDAVDSYINIISELYEQHLPDKNVLEEFIANGGWKARKNGRDLSISMGYDEKSTATENIIEVHNPKVDWKTWIKTIGILINDDSPYRVLFRNEEFTFTLKPIDNGYEIRYNREYSKSNPLFVKLFKNVFRKSACCIGCGECEADCHNNCISMTNGKVTISEQCVHCAQCHKVENGCLISKSLEMPKGGLLMAANKSLNCYSHHAPKADWFKQYFEYKNDFDQKNTLGSQMYSFFKRFLRDSELLDENGFTRTAQIIEKIGLENPTAWAIMLTNLSYTPQINWFVKRMNMGETYTKEYTLALLVQDGAKESWVNDIWSSFGRFVELPFNEVGMGHSYKEKNRVVSITRSPWEHPEPLVILYSLYKFAEACGSYYQFTLGRLLDHDIDSDGVSPTEIFGLDRAAMEKLLTGLNIQYPDFITAQFNLDLDTITLKSDKKSEDVLALF